MSNTICIYHGNCADGFGAAWVVRKALGDAVEFHPGVYQTPPPDVTGRDVILVDFSYKRPVLDRMAQTARSILILDHHKSAAEDLASFCVLESKPGALSFLDFPWILRDLRELQRPPVMALFDMENSGAMLAWRFFFPGEEPPQLLRHIEDRDLWRFSLEGTREIQACLFSYPYEFAVWDDLMSSDPSRLIADGQAIERKHHKDIAELVDVTMRHMDIGGHRVPVANLPYTMSSDAGHLLCEGNPFAACYWDTPDGRVFSLRSNEQGVDVSEVAKTFGGGGHQHAAGFKVPLDHPLAANPA